METLVCDVSPLWSSRTVGTAPGHAAWLNNWRKRSSACRGSSLVGLTVSCVDYLNRLSQSFFSEEKSRRRGLVALRFIHQRGVGKSDIISQPEAEHIQYLTSKSQPPSASNGRVGWRWVRGFCEQLDLVAFTKTHPVIWRGVKCQSAEQYLTEGGDQKLKKKKSHRCLSRSSTSNTPGGLWSHGLPIPELPDRRQSHVRAVSPFHTLGRWANRRGRNDENTKQKRPKWIPSSPVISVRRRAACERGRTVTMSADERVRSRALFCAALCGPLSTYSNQCKRQCVILACEGKKKKKKSLWYVWKQKWKERRRGQREHTGTIRWSSQGCFVAFLLWSRLRTACVRARAHT